jgi:hypothetical protein
VGLLKKKPVKGYVWRKAWYGAETCTFRESIRSNLALNMALKKNGDQFYQMCEK